MPRDDRNLLDVLKFELEFLEQGGYGRLPREAWRARFVFEDSPTCMNFNSKDREPCEECLLMQFVPEEARTEQVPCIHIPLSPAGETLDSLYRTGTQQEIEEALGAWLRSDDPPARSGKSETSGVCRFVSLGDRPMLFPSALRFSLQPHCRHRGGCHDRDHRENRPRNSPGKPCRNPGF